MRDVTDIVKMGHTVMSNGRPQDYTNFHTFHSRFSLTLLMGRIRNFIFSAKVVKFYKLDVVTKIGL